MKRYTLACKPNNCQPSTIKIALPLICSFASGLEIILVYVYVRNRKFSILRTPNCSSEIINNRCVNTNVRKLIPQRLAVVGQSVCSFRAFF